jgi:hypothetical protein
MSLPESFFDECAEMVEEHRREHEDPDRYARRRAERLGRPYVAPTNSQPKKPEIKMTKLLTIEIDEQTHADIVRHAEEAGTTAEKHAANLIEQALRSIDAEPAKRTDADDPDNGDSRRKERPPLPPAATAREIAEIQNRVNFLLSEGRFSEAKDLQKITDAYYKSPGQAKQTDAAIEQQRSVLVESIAQSGNRLFGK